MRIAISQPNYLPWLGYFQLISSVETFVFLDDVQYTSRDWRNRNLIKTNNGLEWISIGVSLPRGRTTLINETQINDENWIDRHLKSLRHAYKRSREFENHFPKIEEMLLSKVDENNLCRLNVNLTQEIAELMSIKTKFLLASEIAKPNDKNARLIDICKELNAKTYVSGPAAKAYIEESEFLAENIDLEFFTYKTREYSQLFGKFEAGVSIVDTILNTGEKAHELL